MEKAVIDGVELRLSHPDTTECDWVGQEELMDQLKACWLKVDPRDLALSPRLIGLPGIGKTTLAIATARHLGREVYVFQCTADTRPEDLLVTPVLSEEGRIAYHASTLVTAMIRGGICVLDEGNRMNEKSWASLAPLLDIRRYVESVVAGIVIQAHEEFRCCVTMNEDASTYEIPDYIMSRLQPAIEIDFPAKEDELQILKYNIPFAPKEILGITVEFLAQAHGLKLPFSSRDGINVIRYALKRIEAGEGDMKSHWEQAIRQVLGEDALELDELARKKRRHDAESLGLGDFFFEPGDDLNPDK
jgi:DNA polymerase III delta prime subunit